MNKESTMQVLYEEKLKEFVGKKLAGIDKNRYCYPELKEYLKGNNGDRLCCICGLLKTGKTTLMCQAIDDFLNYDGCLFVICEDGDLMQDLHRTLKEHRAYTYVFIDEITKISNFINTSSMISNYHKCLGREIVISGTDSLSFLFASSDSLFDRLRYIHTTYISFDEYNYLSGKDFDEYLRYGGTLGGGSPFYKDEAFKEYINTAIVGNIKHSLENFDLCKWYVNLTKLYNRGELATGIKEVIEIYNRRFLLDSLKQTFSADGSGSVNELLINKGLKPIGNVDDFIPTECRLVQLDEYEITSITQYLLLIDVLEKLYPRYDGKFSFLYAFTQPGLRYCQVETLKNEIMESDMFGDYDEITKKEIAIIVDRDIHRRIAEEVVTLDKRRKGSVGNAE
jgi:hypothetical protein